MSDAAPDVPGAAAAQAPEGPLDRLGLDDAPERGSADMEAEPEVTAPGSPSPEADPAGPAGVPLPGAYVPPSTLLNLPPAAPAVQMPLAASPAVGAPPRVASPGWTPPSPVVPTVPPAPPGEAGRASLFADLPFDAPDSVTEWLVAIGSAAAAGSFLLPWISGTTSYLTSWGLGAPSRFPILALLVVTAILGILPNRVALWIRAGVLGLIGGSIFLGNIWPIVAGDFGDAAFGAVVGAAAAIVLIVGGILGVAPRKPGADAG
jgi:hypothetical protein